MPHPPMEAFEMAQRCIDYLNSPEGREALRLANERTKHLVELLKATRPTKETWEWTPTI